MTTSSNNSKAKRYLRRILLVFAAISLFFAQSATWAKHTLFDQETFTSTLTNTITTEQNRQAIAATVVDAALSNRPALRSAIGERMQSFVSALLATDMGTRLTAQATNAAYSLVVSSEPEDVSLQLTTVKVPLTKIIALVNETDLTTVNFDPSKIPDEIIFVHAEQIPNINKIYRAFVWLAPLVWLLTAALFAGYLYASRKQLKGAIGAVYIAVMVVGIIGLATGPFVPSVIESIAPDANTGIVAASITSAFLRPFIVAMWQMMFAVSVAFILYLRRKQIYNATQKIVQKITHQKAK